MVEFSEGKFILCRELFLTKSSVNRVEKSIPFCDRGVFRMFISNLASCLCNKVYFTVYTRRRVPGVEKCRILQQGFMRRRSSDGVPVVSDIVKRVSPLFTMYG